LATDIYLHSKLEHSYRKFVPKDFTVVYRILSIYEHDTALSMLL
jgi:hypothetical protein